MLRSSLARIVRNIRNMFAHDRLASWLASLGDSASSDALRRLCTSIATAARIPDVKESDDGISLARVMRYENRDLKRSALQPIDNPFGTRLSPMS
jgi:hypothetical protein